MRRFAGLLLLTAVGLGACKDEPAAPEKADAIPTPERTVAFFLANPDEHDAVKRFCKNDPGRLRNTPDCINADQAQKQIFVWGREEALRRSKEGS